MAALTDNINDVRKAVSDKKKTEEDDFTFTYEEEADPEIFFVPYVWEVIVSVTTAGSIEWTKENIKVFPLLSDEAIGDVLEEAKPIDPTKFSADVADVV